MPLFAKFKYGGRNVISGSDAGAIATKLCRPSVISAYPITPQTIIVERLAEMVNNGEMKAEMVKVESEHSAASVQMGAQATGVRTVGASCSQGLLLMNEVLHVISGLRLPCVIWKYAEWEIFWAVNSTDILHLLDMISIANCLNRQSIS